MIIKLIEQKERESVKAQEQASRLGAAAARSIAKAGRAGRITKKGGLRAGVSDAFAAGLQFGEKKEPKNKGRRMATPTAAEKHRHTAALIAYMTNPSAPGEQRDAEHAEGRATGREKCVAWGAENFSLAAEGNVAEHIREMADLAGEAKRGGDPIVHVVLSWQPGDRPTVEQMRQAALTTVAELDLADHQWVWAVHNDRGHLHIHVALNRVDPISFKLKSAGHKGLYKESLARAAAKVCFEQKWEAEPGARYEYDGKRYVKTVQSDTPPLSPGASRFEHETGVSSIQGRAQAAFARVDLSRAGSWQEFHTAMQAAGLRYERIGSGAFIRCGDEGVKASSVARSLSYPKLESKFGRFQPQAGTHANLDFEWLKQQARAERTDLSGPEILWAEAGDLLFELPERDLAGGTEEQGRTGILYADREDYGRSATGLRRSPDSENEHRDEVAVRPALVADLIPPELRERHQDHQREIDAARLARRTAREILQKRHHDERETLAAAQRNNRQTGLAGDWSGRGDALNALRAVMAGEHRKQIGEMRKRHKMERDSLPRAREELAFADWLKANGRDKDVQLLEEWRSAVVTHFILETPPAPTIDREQEAKMPELRQFELVTAPSTSPVIWAARDHKRRNIHIVDAGDKLTLRAGKQFNDFGAFDAALALAAGRGGAVRIEASPAARNALNTRLVPIAAAKGVRLANPELEAVRQQLMEQTARLNAPPASPVQTAFDEYHAAIGADAYRITSTTFRQDGGLNQTDGQLHLDLAPPALVRANVGSIASQQEEDIYYSPISYEKWHPQLNLTTAKLAELTAAGYRPAAVIESSIGHFQAIFSVPKPAVDEDVSREAANAVIRALNKRYGVSGFSEVIHTHRAPGTLNPRDDGSFPVVMLRERAGGVCLKLSAEIAAQASRIITAGKSQVSHVEPKPRGGGVTPTPTDNLSRLYEAHREDITGQIRDESHADYIIGIRLRATGHSRTEIKTALAASPGLDERNKTIPGYLNRTLDAIYLPKATGEIQGFAQHLPEWKRLENKALGIDPPKKEFSEQVHSPASPTPETKAPPQQPAAVKSPSPGRSDNSWER